MMTRRLAHPRLFYFDAAHVPGNKNGVADAISRRGATAEDEAEDEEVDK
jgi:hypothetical protein